jgi:hypothetical protein
LIDPVVPKDWCPVCLDSERRGPPTYKNQKEIEKFFVTPVSFGTVILRPTFEEKDLDLLAPYFEMGEIVDTDGYRSRGLWIMNDDGSWERLKEDDPIHIPLKYWQNRGKKYYYDNYDHYYYCLFETPDGEWEEWEHPESAPSSDSE